ncbi:hypothetical protein BBJ28_00002611 [Nothophytophthora sp. Chile5]|nr:hypothetical protein BBJ28_00002611 [Nothophytophthora sp. Chile5]
MEATGVYPNWPPVLATTGLGGSLAGTDPDHVPLEPDLINDPRRRYAAHGGAVDAGGVLRLHVRNAQGYAYLRPHKQAKLGALGHMHSTKTSDVTAQAMHYRRNYRHYVPDELLTHHLQRESPPEEDAKHIPKRQGNALAGVDRGPDGHVVFYPTGQVLQQACAWYSGGEMESDKSCTSSTVETGAAIRQYAVMGDSDAYFSAGNVEIYAAARGAANCTVLATPARATTGNRAKMRAKAKLSFPEMLYHVAGSPHAEAELAFVTGDGVVRRWDPEGGVQTVKTDPVAASDHFLRCEYSRYEVGFLSLVLWPWTQPALPATQRNTLFDLAGVGSAFADIYGLKRRTSLPCGITGQSSHSDESVARTMPLPSDAILPEHDTDSLATFTMAPIKVLLRKFPRLPDGGLSGGNEDIDGAEPEVATKHAEEHYDEALLAEKLAVVCRPSTSLARLHRYVVNQLKLPLSSQELLRFLRSRSDFRIWSSSTPLDTLRVLTPPSSRNAGGSVHWTKDDVRLAACSCHLETLSPASPCESLSCVIPHLLIISGSSSGSWLDKKTPSTAQQPIPDEFAAAIEDARAAYGRDNF